MMEIKIYQQNMCGNDKNKNLLSVLNGLKEVIKREKPDAIFLSEVSHSLYQDIKNDKEYKEYKYKIVQPVKDIAKNDTAACLLLVKKRYAPDEAKKRRHIFMKKKRYIETTLQIGNFQMECFFAYVQQCSPTSNLKQNKKNIEAKAEMLFGAYLFLLENEGKNIFVGGDLNTDLDDPEAKCKGVFKLLYNEMEDTLSDEIKDKETHNGKRLDYALVSKSVNCTTTYIERKETGSDHKGLLSTITF